jgi:hypothetical protein
MVLGLVQYSLGGRYLGTAGELKDEARLPAARAAARHALLRAAEAIVGLFLIFTALDAMGAIHLTLVGFVDWTGLFIVALAAAFALRRPVRRSRLWRRNASASLPPASSPPRASGRGSSRPGRR